MKISIISGARPNFMKIAPLIRSIQKYNEQGHDLTARVIYTGPEDDPALEPSLFADLDMPSPDIYLGVSETDFYKRFSGIITTFAEELRRHPADIVIVVDDFTPTMACTIVARKMGIKVAHLVAGTRSFDKDVKEINRVVTDGLADILFTAGMTANRNLAETGKEGADVYFVGNILIDTLRYNHTRITRPVSFSIMDIEDGRYILLTLNRRDLADNETRLRTIINTIINTTTLPIIAPMHTYIKDRLDEIGIHSDRLHLLPPQSYLSFGYMTNHARAIITDSGNIAEEATFLGIPCITLNTYAEHPETIRRGTNELVGEDPSKIATALKKAESGEWKKGGLPERWDGHTADRIIQILLKEFECPEN